MYLYKLFSVFRPLAVLATHLLPWHECVVLLLDYHWSFISFRYAWCFISSLDSTLLIQCVSFVIPVSLTDSSSAHNFILTTVTILHSLTPTFNMQQILPTKTAGIYRTAITDSEIVSDFSSSVFKTFLFVYFCSVL